MTTPDAVQRAEVMLADMMAAHGGLTGDAAVRWLAECLDAYATERARPALERADRMAQLAARGHDLVVQAQNRADAAGRERDSALAQLAVAREDVVQSAGLLLVDVPEPGTDLARVLLAVTAARRERDRLRSLLTRPFVGRWSDEVLVEAAHQVQRWGAQHDAGKQPEDWFWLVGYLAGKALRAAITGDTSKARHHTVSTAAVLANWAANIGGADSEMRPGLGAEALARLAVEPPVRRPPLPQWRCARCNVETAPEAPSWHWGIDDEGVFRWRHHCDEVPVV